MKEYYCKPVTYNEFGEVCTAEVDAEANAWAVYEHDEEGCSGWLADCATQQVAYLLLKALRTVSAK